MRKSLLMKMTTIALSLLVGWSLAAQQKVTVSGVVVDDQNEPMIAAGVVQKGTTNGTITDIDGNFTLTVPAGATIEFSSVGYVTFEFVATKSEDKVMVQLLTDTQMIEETVVVGYGVQRKSDVTGAISQVKSEDIQNRTIVSAESALAGKTAGVQTFASSAKPGATPTIRIRGISSNGSSDPLYVVDGRITSSISSIDPNDIESMEVLKDAASAAIYGAQAGNGVILITTRKGKGDGQISYSYQFTSQSLGNIPKIMNAVEYAQYYLDKGTYTLGEIYNMWDLKTNTDWIGYCFEPSMMHHHNLTFSGGNERGSLYTSVSYLDNNGMLKGNNDFHRRFTGMVNASWKFKSWLDVQTNNQVEYYVIRSVSDGSSWGSPITAALQLDPLTPPLYAPDQLPDFMQQYVNEGKHLLRDADGNYYSISQFNKSETMHPLTQLEASYSIMKGFTLNGSTAINFHPIDGLNITSRFGYRLTSGDSYGYTNDYYVSPSKKADYMSVSSSTSNSIYYQWENFANYMRQFGKHNLNAMIGMSYSQTRSYSTNAGVSGSDNSGVIDFGLIQDNPLFYYIAYATPTAIKTVGGGMETYSRKLSYFGRVAWNYMGKYHLQVSLRADAADLAILPKPMRWGYFPAVSGGWTLSDEAFFQPVKNIFPYVKIRASWGQNGSLAGLGSYMYANDITTDSSVYPTGAVLPNGSYEYLVGAAPSSTGNDELKWETSEQIDLGLDLRFLRDRLSVSFDWYNKTTKDLIVMGITPSTVVGIDASPVNAGNVKNTGIELEARWKDQVGDFFYSVSGNFSTLKNVVTYLHPTLKDGINGQINRDNMVITRFEKGYPAWHFYGYQFDHIDSETGNPVFVDYDGVAGPTDGDKVDLGSGIPTFNYGLTFNAGWKGIDFLVFIAGAGGHKIWADLYVSDYNANHLKAFTENRWTETNRNGTVPAANSTQWGNYMSSSGAIFKGDYMKVKQIQLGYTFPANLTRRIFIQNLRVYASLDDFFTITNYPGFDPEIVGSGSSTGVDKGNFPTSKKVVFGVNVTF